MNGQKKTRRSGGRAGTRVGEGVQSGVVRADIPGVVGDAARKAVSATWRGLRMPSIIHIVTIHTAGRGDW
jgi:hypothetical protein